MRIVGGVVLMVVGGLWALVWGVVALIASGLGSDAGLLGWVLLFAAIALGALVFVWGASLMRRRGPETSQPERPPQTPARREW